MIYGRPAALWGGLVQAVLNVIGAIIVVYTGQQLTAELVALFAALNALGLTVIGVLANQAVNGSSFGRTATPKK